MLFLTGCLAVLGLTFLLGVLAGRQWPRAQSPLSPTAAKAAKEAAPLRGGDRAARPTEPAPTLTFYHELTAPLTSPPPAKSAKPGRVDKPETSKPAPTELPATASPQSAAFTIQVAAYKSKEPAEALRARLASGGLDAYVAQIDATSGARFRVRVGAFATREAAQQVADRIGSERSLSAFVTAR